MCVCVCVCVCVCMGGGVYELTIYVFMQGIFVFPVSILFSLSSSVLENLNVYLYRYSCTILNQVKSEVE